MRTLGSPPFVLSVLTAFVLVLLGCSTTSTPTITVPTPVVFQPTPTLNVRQPIESELRGAFRLADPYARRAAVLRATEVFLRDPVLRATDDAIASSYFTNVAFSSGQLTLPDPAVIQRQRDLAVVALPEGLGLFLYDLSAPLGTVPLEMSPWVVGLRSLRVAWGADELGVAFMTQGEDAITRAHFVLASHQSTGWRTDWISDEEPDWWFNAYGATLTVEHDLSRLVLAGEATGTTQVFYEQKGEPRRIFEVVWERQGSTYAPSPLVSSFPTWQAWLWDTVKPSPYATLVEFIERIQVGNESTTGHLITDEAVILAALDYGLDQPERRYQVVEVGQDYIIFRDLQGTYIADFQPPAPGGAPWLVTRLRPYGEATPTPAGQPES